MEYLILLHSYSVQGTEKQLQVKCFVPFSTDNARHTNDIFYGQ